MQPLSNYFDLLFKLADGSCTRDHRWELVKEQSRCDARLYFFSLCLLDNYVDVTGSKAARNCSVASMALTDIILFELFILKWRKRETPRIVKMAQMYIFALTTIADAERSPMQNALFEVQSVTDATACPIGHTNIAHD